MHLQAESVLQVAREGLSVGSSQEGMEMVDRDDCRQPVFLKRRWAERLTSLGCRRE